MRGGGEREGPATCPGGGAFEVYDKFQDPVKNSIPHAHPPPPTHTPLKHTELDMGWSFKIAAKIKIRVMNEVGEGSGPSHAFLSFAAKLSLAPTACLSRRILLARRQPPT